MMSIYSVLIIIGFIATLYTLNKRPYRKKVCFIFLLSWTILVTLRGYSVGNDTAGYTYFFSGKIVNSLHFTDYGTIDNPDESIEFGFILIAKLLSFVSTSPTFLFGITAIVFFTALYNFYKDRNYSTIGLIWLFTSTYYMMNIIYATRQCIAVGVLLWGIYLFNKGNKTINYNTLSNIVHLIREKYFSILLLLLSVTIHRTSIFLLLLYIAISNISVSKKTASILITISCLISVVFSTTISDLFTLIFVIIGNIDITELAVLSRYSDSMSNELLKFLNILSWVVPGFLTIYTCSKEEIKNNSFKFFVFSIVLHSFFGSSPYFGRFLVFLLILGYPTILPAKAKSNRIIMLCYMCITCFYVYRMLTLYANWPVDSSDLPYKFVWE